MNQKIEETLNRLKKYLSNDLAKNIKENWRIILVAAIVVAVFASSWENSQKPQSNSSSNTTGQNAETPQNTPAESQPENNSNDSNVAQAKEEPAVLGESTVKETAAKSEGVTHLARRAVKEYLGSAGDTLSPEQKIYAEDYLKRQIGSQPLEIGQTIEFKTDMIKTGIEKAKTLNQKEIENLSKYVPLVKNL